MLCASLWFATIRKNKKKRERQREKRKENEQKIACDHFLGRAHRQRRLAKRLFWIKAYSHQRRIDACCRQIDGTNPPWQQNCQLLMLYSCKRNSKPTDPSPCSQCRSRFKQQPQGIKDVTCRPSQHTQFQFVLGVKCLNRTKCRENQICTFLSFSNCDLSTASEPYYFGRILFLSYALSNLSLVFCSTKHI